MSQVHQYLNELDKQDNVESRFRKLMSKCTLIDFRVLASVKDEPKRLSALSDIRGTTPQGAGKVCKRLNKNGFVQIKRDSRDGRARIVSITEKGERLNKACERALGRALR